MTFWLIFIDWLNRTELIIISCITWNPPLLWPHIKSVTIAIFNFPNYNLLWLVIELHLSILAATSALSRTLTFLSRLDSPLQNCAIITYEFHLYVQTFTFLILFYAFANGRGHRWITNCSCESQNMANRLYFCWHRHCDQNDNLDGEESRIQNISSVEMLWNTMADYLEAISRW